MKSNLSMRACSRFQILPVLRLAGATALLPMALWLIPTALWFYAFPVWLPWKTLISFVIGTIPFLLALLLASDNNKYVGIAFYAVYALIASVYSVHILLYHTQPSSITIAALYETNLAEAKEFILSYSSAKTAAAVIFCWLLPVPFLYVLWHWSFKPHRNLRMAAVLLLIAATGIALINSPSKTWKYNPLWQSYAAYRQYWQKKDALADLSRDKVAGILKKYGRISKIDSPVTLVVLIGESAARNHHGCYGYPRDTTPHACRRARQLLFFTDIISAAPFTVPSHAKMLLLPVQNENDKLPLMHVLDAAGLQSWWITSQYTYDSTASPLPLLADHVISINASIDKQQFFDEEILLELNTVLNSRKESGGKVIFLNIMGSHVQYASRYPHKFDTFIGSEGIVSRMGTEPAAQKIINAYDNSIRYTDYIIDQILEMLEKIPNSAFIYLSDHGQDVYDEEQRYGHSITRDCGYEIPFYLWCSPSFVQWRGNGADMWKDCTDRPAMSSCLGFMLLDMLNIEFNDSNRALSPISPAYSPRKQRIISDYDYVYGSSRKSACLEKKSACKP